MRVIGLFQYLLGRVSFTSEGGNQQRFLTQCMLQHIELSGIRAAGLGFRAELPAREYKKLRAIARKTGCRLRIARKRGLYFSLHRYRRRAGIPAGMLLAAAALFLFPRILWSISYYNCTGAEQQVLSDCLFEHGICPGAVLSDAQLQSAEQRILMENSGYAWISLNFAKGRLVVEKQNIDPQPEILGSSPSDIVAKHAGILLSMEVYEGFAQKKPGQSVAQGEVLVHGGAPDQTGAETLCRSRAHILAYFEQSYPVSVPLSGTAQTLSAPMQHRRALYFLGRFWGGWTPRQPFDRDIYAQHGVTVLGLPLPVTLYEEAVSRPQETVYHLSEEEALSRARAEAEQKMYGEFPDIELIDSAETSKTENGSLEYTLRITARADIALEVPQNAPSQGQK